MKTLSENPYCDEVALLYAPARSYVIGVVELMLRHIWQLAKEKSTSVEDQFGNVAWLARLLTLDQRVRDVATEAEVPQWIRVRGKLIEILDTCENNGQLDSAVNECINLNIPLLKDRFVEKFRFKRRPFKCWWYTIHNEETLVAVHFVNGYMPESPFKICRIFKNLARNN